MKKVLRKIRSRLKQSLAISLLRLAVLTGHSALVAAIFSWVAWRVPERLSTPNNTVLCLGRTIFVDDVKALAQFSGKLDYMVVHLQYFAQLFRHFFTRDELAEMSEANYHHNPAIRKGREQYANFLRRLWPVLAQRFGLVSVMSGNFDYFVQQELAAVVEELKVPFIVLHKEGMMGFGGSDYLRQNIKQYENTPFVGSKMLFYNEGAKQALLQAHITGFVEEKMEVVGVPRLDAYFEKLEAGRAPRQVVFFSFYPPERFRHLVTGPKMGEIENRSRQIHEWVMKFAKNHPDTKVIVKTKNAQHYYKYVQDIAEELFEQMPRNLNITNSANLIEVIQNSSVVVGYNSTTLVEALAAGKKVISADFSDLLPEKEEDFFTGYFDLLNFARSENELEQLILTQTEQKIEPARRDEFLKIFMSTPDGQASKRAEAAIIETIKESGSSMEREMNHMLRRLFPICRSLTGDGNRQTLSILREYVPIEVCEVASGTRAFDWTVPKEWKIRDAYIVGPDGKRYCEFKKNNLHVMSYSVPVRTKMRLDELKAHLFSLPEQPEFIPYRTSYYTSNWGFCLADRQLQTMPEGEYEVVIDSKLEEGQLIYGEYFLPGETDQEILLSTYICHPSLANDNLSGIVLATFLARHLQKMRNRRYSYRFLFTPETIGPLVWLSKNEDRLSNVKHGFVITCVGDDSPFTYKKSRQGNAEIDQAVLKVLSDSGKANTILDFYPYGSDERQYSSPGLNLQVGCLMRAGFGRFTQYHTSADDLTFVNGHNIFDSLQKYLEVLELLENNLVYENLKSKGEPMLSKYNLYKKPGGATRHSQEGLAVFWVLNQSDGTKSLLEIAMRSQMKFSEIAQAARKLQAAKLIKLIKS